MVLSKLLYNETVEKKSNQKSTNRLALPCRLSFYFIAVLFLTAASLMAITGCIARPSVKSVRIIGESHNSTTDETRVYFLNDDEPIIAIVNLENITQRVKLSTEWRFLARGTIVHSSEETVKESGEKRVRLNRKPNESELGDYRVDVLINGEVASISYFSIVDELPEPPPYDVMKKDYEKKYGKIENPADNKKQILSDFATASEVYGLTQAPKELCNKFVPDTPVVYLTMFMSDAPINTKIRVDWFYMGTDGATEMLIIPAELETSGTRQLAFNMKPGTGDLPIGKYEARVFLNGAELERVAFSVVGAKPTRQ